MKSSKFQKKLREFKAIVLDVDGTTIPNSRYGKPSLKVKKAIEKASKQIHVAFATGRPYFMVRPIIDALKISAPCIINSGTEIVESLSGKTLWEQTLRISDIDTIFKILKPYNKAMLIHDDGKDIEDLSSYKPKRPLAVGIFGLTPKQADEIIEKFSDIPTVVVHKLPSWTNGELVIDVTHAAASKQHAILELAKILGIQTHEIIGVGDGYNDFPLLMACGLKIAMGNAVDDLKAIADYIAPTVEEDGVAHVIEKFVLN